MLNRESRQLCVRHQRASRLALHNRLAEKTPVVVPWAEQADIGLVHPLIHYINHFGRCKALARQSRVRHDPDKCRNGLPRQPHRICPGQHLFEPRSCLRVLI